MKQRKTTRKEQTTKSNHRVGIATACVKSQVVVFLSGLVLLSACCAIALSTEDSNPLLRPMALSALFLSALFGGFAAVRMSAGGILSGVCSGVVTTLLLLLLSLLPIGGTNGSFSLQPLMYLCIILSSVAGSLIGARRKAKSRHKAKMKKR